jgi:putative glutamine amidotransferase
MPPKPIIGISIDSEPPGGYSAHAPWYALRQNYCESVSDAGGVPVLLPHDVAAIARYVEMCAGFLIPGGGFDVDPKLYGAVDVHPTVKTKPGRTAFEKPLVESVLGADKPILGICNGAQLINVVMGGDLIQHIPDTIAGALDHSQKPPYDAPAHDIDIVAATMLRGIAGIDRARVNTSHHQSIRSAGKNLRVNATSPDGVIEGVESTTHRFCLGVQWHPEYAASSIDQKLFEALCHAAR